MLYNIGLISAIHQHELAIGVHTAPLFYLPPNFLANSFFNCYILLHLLEI